MTWCAPSFFTHACELSREAVAIIVAPVIFLASCNSIEPTPPAAPTTKIISSVVFLSLGDCCLISRCSNNNSQAVIVVSGKAAVS